MDSGEDSPPGRKIVRTTYAGNFLDRGGPSLSYRKRPKYQVRPARIRSASPSKSGFG